MIAYYNGHFCDKAAIVISPDDRGFLFGDGLYEVMRSYEGKLFELELHLARLAYGLDQLRITGVDLGQTGAMAQELLLKNSLLQGDATIYLQITRGVAERVHHFPAAGTPPTLYACARRLSPNRELPLQGVPVVSVADQRWSRCDIKATGLAANVLASQAAKEKNAFEALFVRGGFWLEGSRTNVFFVKNNVLRTAAADQFILHGVTRAVVLRLARSLGIENRESAVTTEEVAQVEEAFLAGTTIEILPIIKIDGRTISGGQPGPITCRLRDALRHLTAGLRVS
jgi:D-alanine transaminase